MMEDNLSDSYRLPEGATLNTPAVRIAAVDQAPPAFRRLVRQFSDRYIESPTPDRWEALVLAIAACSEHSPAEAEEQL